MRAIAKASHLQRVFSPSSSKNVFVKGFATYKTSTGIVGLAVDVDALNTLSEKVLESVKV